MTDNEQTVEKGDLFRDNDPRLPAPRVVKVLVVNDTFAHVEVVEHWNEKLIGRQTYVTRSRLARGKNRQTGYTKVSR